jgi:hypothetical protein
MLPVPAPFPETESPPRPRLAIRGETFPRPRPRPRRFPVPRRVPTGRSTCAKIPCRDFPKKQILDTYKQLRSHFKVRICKLKNSWFKSIKQNITEQDRFTSQQRQQITTKWQISSSKANFTCTHLDSESILGQLPLLRLCAHWWQRTAHSWSRLRVSVAWDQ